MPRLMFTWAPLEASFALSLFGILSGVDLRTDCQLHFYEY